MTVRHCCLTCLLSLVVTHAALAQERERSWEVPVSICGLSFRTTGDWVVSRDPPRVLKGACWGELKHRSYDKLVKSTGVPHFWMIEFDARALTFEEAMTVYDIRRDEDRRFVGVHWSPAYEIKGPGWRGLRADSIEVRSGSPSAASEAVWVLISSTVSNRTAQLVIGSGADEEALPLLLNSVRFEPRR